MSDLAKINIYMVTAFASLLLICIFLLTLFSELTHDRILDNRQLSTRKIIDDIIPRPYLNNVFEDVIEVSESGYLGGRQAVHVYRARNNEEASGVVFYPVVADGYHSQIELGVGIYRDGTVSGVRVINENETEGLGDLVNQDKSDWILSFTGVSYNNVPREEWAVKSENGYFDQVSGATITSRSVINAVRNTLDYHNLARDTLYK